MPLRGMDRMMRADSSQAEIRFQSALSTAPTNDHLHGLRLAQRQTYGTADQAQTNNRNLRFSATHIPSLAR